MMPLPPTRFSTTTCWPSVSRQPRGHHPAGHVDVAAGRERNQQLDRPVRPALRLRECDAEALQEGRRRWRRSAACFCVHGADSMAGLRKIRNRGRMVRCKCRMRVCTTDRRPWLGGRRSPTSPSDVTLQATSFFDAFVLIRPLPSIGRRTTTVVPTPNRERMRIAPPCSSTSDLAMARPRPEP